MLCSSVLHLFRWYCTADGPMGGGGGVLLHARLLIDYHCLPPQQWAFTLRESIVFLILPLRDVAAMMLEHVAVKKMLRNITDCCF